MFLAFNKQFQKFAIKKCNAFFNDQEKEKAEYECKALELLRPHPNIINIHMHGYIQEEEKERLILVLDYLPGTLIDYIDRMREKQYYRLARNF